MSQRIPWGNHTRQWRDRTVAKAQADWGLNRRQVREMYNRGTFRPAARNPEDRIPRKIIKEQAKKRPPGVPGPTLSDSQMRALLIKRMDDQLDRIIKYTPGARERIIERFDQLSHATLMLMVDMSDDVREAAKWQDRDIRHRRAPRNVRKIAIYNEFEDTWTNPFWYH